MNQGPEVGKKISDRYRKVAEEFAKRVVTELGDEVEAISTVRLGGTGDGDGGGGHRPIGGGAGTWQDTEIALRNLHRL